MSEYFLADRKAEERARQKEPQQQTKAGEIKVTLLGDFLFPSQESPGADPYNSTQGKAVREAWKTRRDRR
jgi:hypothetical protein